MSAWSDLVKKLCKQNPGKPLGAILPLAKKMYKGTKKNIANTKNAFKKVNRNLKNKSKRRSSRRR
jgi:hypothetical protein